MPLQNFPHFVPKNETNLIKRIFSSVFSMLDWPWIFDDGLLILTSKTNGSPRLRMRLAASMPISSRPRILG